MVKFSIYLNRRVFVMERLWTGPMLLMTIFDWLTIFDWYLQSDERNYTVKFQIRYDEQIVTSLDEVYNLTCVFVKENVEISQEITSLTISPR